MDSPINKQPMQGGNKTMSVKEIRQLRTQIMMTALTLSIRNEQTLLKAVDSVPSAPSSRPKGPAVLIQEFTRSGVQELAQS